MDALRTRVLRLSLLCVGLKNLESVKLKDNRMNALQNRTKTVWPEREKEKNRKIFKNNRPEEELKKREEIQTANQTRKTWYWNKWNQWITSSFRNSFCYYYFFCLFIFLRFFSSLLSVFLCGFVFKNSHVTLIPELVVYKKNKQTKTNSSVCKWRCNRMAYPLSPSQFCLSFYSILIQDPIRWLSLSPSLSLFPIHLLITRKRNEYRRE